MPEQKDTDQNRDAGEQPAPANIAEGQAKATGGEQPNPPQPEQDATRPKGEQPTKSTWREIKVLDAINTLIAVGTLVVAFAAYRIATDTSDIKAAIANLDRLAVQTKRQADETHNQLAQIRREADALSAQVDQMKRQATASEAMATNAQAQTKAISAQTGAIKASSDANIRSANAQREMADTTTKSQKPRADLIDLAVDKLAGTADGTVTGTIFWRFRNIGGGYFVVKDVRYGLQIGNFLPQEMPKGAAFYGADIAVSNSITSAFAPANPLEFQFKNADFDALTNGHTQLFFFAVIHFTDATGVLHERCFGRQFIFAPKAISSTFAIPVGGPAYQCDT